MTLFFISCDSSNHSPTNFNWLNGDWIRVNEEEGKTTFESWEKLNENEFRGVGYTLQGLDTIFKENIKLIRKTKRWIFEVSGVNETPTAFELVAVTDTSFTAENEQNPFPKKIKYWIEGDQLNAVVSAEETKIQFTFERNK